MPRISRRFLATLTAGWLALAATPALASGPPQVTETWVNDVSATSANLRAKINPEGLSTSYRFEYLTQAAYEANGDTFAGASLAPPSGAAAVGSGNTPAAVAQHVGSLAPATAYRYRVRATSGAGTEYGPERVLATTEPTNLYPPIDGRGWELVSPVDKDGGAVGAPESIFGGGDFQAATDGETFTFSSTSSFGEAAGAPSVSQYVSSRGGSGWSTANVSAPLESGGYGDHPDGAPFRVFSEDLGRALLLDPRRCEACEECPRSYSLRETATGALTPLPAEAAGMRVVGVSPDLGRILFENEGGEVFAWSGGGLVPSPAPPAPSTERVIGPHRLFVSTAEIPPFDNTDANTGEPDAEVYLEGPPPGGGPSRLICISCNPSGERPRGSASIPGAVANGSTVLYKPRVLSAGGNRVFFDSADRLITPDTDSRPDVYEWEADGVGSCTSSPGCVGLVSGGRGEGGRFLDASADGRDAFFLTGDSLIGADPGSIDVYDFRAGGGFPEPAAPFVCAGDACQALPSPPEDPAPATLAPTSGNPPLKIERLKGGKPHCRKGKVRRHGRCVRKHHHGSGGQR